MIAFLATRPINMIIPKMVKMFNVWLPNARNNKAPIKDNGMENNTTKGVIKLSYSATITRYTKIIEANNAIPNVPKPSV
ncbi:hypothetical protein D3C81_2012410 [compost metagenome]